MFRRIAVAYSITLSLSSIGCSLIYDFEKPGASSVGGGSTGGKASGTESGYAGVEMTNGGAAGTRSISMATSAGETAAGTAPGGVTLASTAGATSTVFSSGGGSGSGTTNTWNGGTTPTDSTTGGLSAISDNSGGAIDSGGTGGGGVASGGTVTTGGSSPGAGPGTVADGGQCSVTASVECCSDSECPALKPICSASHICEQRRAGETCSVAAECSTGICLDGHCCAKSSCGSCQACTSGNGECLPVTNAPDPDSCLGLKVCDSVGTCIERFREIRAAAEPRRIVAGPDGALWYSFGSSGGAGVVRLDTAGQQTEFPQQFTEIPSGLASGTAGINVWFTAHDTGSLGSVNSTGSVTNKSVGSGPTGVVVGADGNIWIMDSGQAPRGEPKVLVVSPEGVEISAFTLPSTEFVSQWVVAGPDGNVWFTQGTSDRIGRITKDMVYTSFPLPTAGSTPQGICVGPDGALWFAETFGNRIGRITTAGAISEFALPLADSNPVGIALGLDGALWFTESTSNKLGRLTTAGKFVEYDVPSSKSLPFDIAIGPDGNVWFTESAAWNIGRFIPPEVP